MAKSTLIRVRAKVAHTQPGPQTYRELGEIFLLEGKLYNHVEPVSKGKAASDEADELEDGDGTAEPSE